MQETTAMDTDMCTGKLIISAGNFTYKIIRITEFVNAHFL